MSSSHSFLQWVQVGSLPFMVGKCIRFPSSGCKQIQYSNGSPLPGGGAGTSNLVPADSGWDGLLGPVTQGAVPRIQESPSRAPGGGPERGPHLHHPMGKGGIRMLADSRWDCPLRWIPQALSHQAWQGSEQGTSQDCIFSMLIFQFPEVVLESKFPLIIYSYEYFS